MLVKTGDYCPNCCRELVKNLDLGKVFCPQIMRFAYEKNSNSAAPLTQKQWLIAKEKHLVNRLNSLETELQKNKKDIKDTEKLLTDVRIAIECMHAR